MENKPGGPPNFINSFKDWFSKPGKEGMDALDTLDSFSEVSEPDKRENAFQALLKTGDPFTMVFVLEPLRTTDSEVERVQQELEKQLMDPNMKPLLIRALIKAEILNRSGTQWGAHPEWLTSDSLTEKIADELIK